MSTSSEITALTERDNFITHLAEAIGSRANVATIFGQPIVRDHSTVVPVGRARWGFGGGGGDQSVDRPSNVRRGFGGGGGMVVNPVGYLVIRDRGVEYHSIHSAMRVVAAIMAGMLLGAILRRRGRGRS